MSLMFSVSGLRGIVGKDLTRDVVIHYTRMFGAFVGKGTVVIGRDTRQSGPAFQRAAIKGLSTAGCRVVDLGVVPSPTVVFAVKKLRARGGIAITASHNPVEWNALKFIVRTGRFMYAGEQEAFRKLCDRTKPLVTRIVQPVTARRYEDGIADHIARIRDILKMKYTGLKVGVDAVNGAGSVALPQLLVELGCRVHRLHCRPGPSFPRGPEPIPANLTKLSDFVIHKRLDIGMACDPDCDRLALVNADGQTVGEDKSLVLCCDFVLEKSPKPVVTNLSTTALVDFVARKHGVRVYRTKVGEANVVKMMEEVGAIIGGEGNGGVIYPRINFTRDALVAAALIVQLMEDKQRSLKALCNVYPVLHMIKEKVRVPIELFDDMKDRLITEHRGEVDLSDGIRITTSRYWLHVRPSQTEPIVRIIGESTDYRQLRVLIDSVVQLFDGDRSP